MAPPASIDGHPVHPRIIPFGTMNQRSQRQAGAAPLTENIHGQV